MPRLTTSVSEETFKVLKEIALRDRRSISVTIELLLQLAIKEKTRKRNAAKDDT
jgi:hypothetical protein|tara:strand:- start:335 stop:496 length:162 start_codon:yes stop_codon:yes gene_type:complete